MEVSAHSFYSRYYYWYVSYSSVNTVHPNFPWSILYVRNNEVSVKRDLTVLHCARRLVLRNFELHHGKVSQDEQSAVSRQAIVSTKRSHSAIRHNTDPISRATSPLYKREGNWAELTFTKTSGAVTWESKRNKPIADRRTDAYLVTIPETIAGRIWAPVPFWFLKWRIRTTFSRKTLNYNKFTLYVGLEQQSYRNKINTLESIPASGKRNKIEITCYVQWFTVWRCNQHFSSYRQVEV